MAHSPEWGRNKNCSQPHGNAIRSKNVSLESERDVSAMAEYSLDFGL
jgi:hypothetical protein